MQFLRANTQVKVVIGPVVAVANGYVPVTTLDLSTADEAELLKHDAGSVTDIAAATFAAITSADGYYNLTLTTSHTDTEGLLTVLINDDSLCLPVKQKFMVLAEAAYDSLFVAKDDGWMDVNIKTIGRADTQETEASNLETACANYSTTRGLSGTALPAAAADAAGGLPISDAGGLDLDNRMPSATSITNLNTVFTTDFSTNYDGTTDRWNVRVAAIDTNAVTADSLNADAATEIAVAVLDKSLAFHTTAGTVGKAISDILEDTGTTLPATLSTIAGYVDTEVAAIVSELAKVPKSDSNVTWNATALASIQSECNDALVAYDPPTNAEMEARTLVAASYATAANQTTIAGYIDTEVAAILAAVDTEVAAIKAKTDQLTFTTANRVDATAITVSDKTGYSLSATGLDLVVPADPSAIPALGTASVVTWIGYFGAWTVNEVRSDSDSVDLRNSANNANLASHATSDSGSQFVSGEPA